MTSHSIRCAFPVKSMSSGTEVKQSEDSASKFTVDIGTRIVTLIFLNSTKGRMDFTVDIDGKPLGKVNVLSQHSIARLAGSAGIIGDAKDEFKSAMLEAGVSLRDGTYTPAPEAQVETEVDTYIGQDSTLGSIDSEVISKFLHSELLLDQINDILHESRTTPFVGDDANLLLTFLVMLSCKSDMPLNLEMVGQSASGKTYLALTARNGFPKSMCMILAGASREALKYDYDEIDDKGNFIVHVDGKCIVILEKDESYSFVKKMKPLMSGDDTELVWKTPIKNELTGEIETRDFIIRGQPSFITLTTKNPKEQEQVTRQLLMTPDTTSDKVANVVRNSLKSRARPESFTIHPDLPLLQASMLALDKHRVRNIFAPLMADFFPARSAQHQRDINKVLSLIDAVTLVHQNQRPIEQVDGQTYLLASVEDNLIGLVLADLVLRASLSGVPDDSWLLFTEMVEMGESKRPLTIDNILQWMHLHAFSMSKNALREKHLPTLEDAGLIEVLRRGGGRGGGRKTYRIVKTRQGLMETHSLSTLFVEATRKNIHDTIGQFSDVLGRANAPKHGRKLAHGEGGLLRSLGCPNKKSSKVWRALFLPTYFRPANDGTVLSRIIGEGDQHDTLFSGQAWLDNTIESTATKDLETKRELKSKVKKMTTHLGSGDTDDVWEAIAEEHLIWNDGEIP
jgi:hypothetical protein